MNCITFVIFSSLHAVDIATDASFIYGELFIFAHSRDNSLFIAWVGHVYYSVRISRRKHLCDLRGPRPIMKIKAIVKYWVTSDTTCMYTCLRKYNEIRNARLHFYEGIVTVDDIIAFHLVHEVVGYGKWTLSLSGRNVFSNAILRSICYAAVSSRWNEIGVARTVLRRPMPFLSPSLTGIFIKMLFINATSEYRRVKRLSIYIVTRVTKYSMR